MTPKPLSKPSAQGLPAGAGRAGPAGKGLVLAQNKLSRLQLDELKAQVRSMAEHHMEQTLRILKNWLKQEALPPGK